MLKTRVMLRKLMVLLIGYSLVSCASSARIQEDVMYKTLVYCGTFQGQQQKGRINVVVTSEAIFKTSQPVPAPEGARCYFKLIPERVVGTCESVYMLYFTWEGTDDVYRVLQNFITGELL